MCRGQRLEAVDEEVPCSCIRGGARKERHFRAAVALYTDVSSSKPRLCFVGRLTSASSSSGSGAAAAFSSSAWYWFIRAESTWTSGGARAGAATNSSDWLPTSLRASQRKGFSKLYCGKREACWSTSTSSLVRLPTRDTHVGLGRDLKVLQVLLAVEGDGTGLDFALLDINLVSAQHNRDRLADALD